MSSDNFWIGRLPDDWQMVASASGDTSDFTEPSEIHMTGFVVEIEGSSYLIDRDLLTDKHKIVGPVTNREAFTAVQRHGTRAEATLMTLEEYRAWEASAAEGHA